MTRKPEATPTVAQCEAAVGEPASAWVARCHEIATKIHAAGLVGGRVVYGHWLGPVHFDSPLYRPGAPFSRHGWVVLDDDSGKVFDPTRWVFEAAKPYLFVGEPPENDLFPCAECGALEEEHGDDGPGCGVYQSPPRWPYDEGGGIFRAVMHGQMPPTLPGDKKRRFRLPKKVQMRLGLPGSLTEHQLLWLANAPYGWLADDAAVVYAALTAMGLGALIPFDNRRRADTCR